MRYSRSPAAIVSTRVQHVSPDQLTMLFRGRFFLVGRNMAAQVCLLLMHMNIVSIIHLHFYEGNQFTRQLEVEGNKGCELK